METRRNSRYSLLMQTVQVVTLIIVLCGVTATFAQAQETTGNVNLVLGKKSLDSGDWAPVENQNEAGIEFDFREASWPVNIALGLRHSEEEGSVFDATLGTLSVTGRTTEVSFGIRKVWDQQATVSPYVGGGLALVDAEAEVRASGASGSDSDSSVGLWLGAGIYFTVVEHLNVGLDFRVTSADATLAGIDVSSGGSHIGLLVGYHF